MRARDLNRVDVEVRRVEELEGKVGLDSLEPSRQASSLNLAPGEDGRAQLDGALLADVQQALKGLEVEQQFGHFFILFSAFVLFCIFFFFLSR